MFFFGTQCCCILFLNACTGIVTWHQLHRAAKGFLIKRAAAVTAPVHSIYFTLAAVPCIETEWIQYILPFLSALQWRCLEQINVPLQNWKQSVSNDQQSSTSRVGIFVVIGILTFVRGFAHWLFCGFFVGKLIFRTGSQTHALQCAHIYVHRPAETWLVVESEKKILARVLSDAAACARVRWGQSTNGTNISYRMNTTAMNNWTHCSMLHKIYSVHHVLLNEHSVQCIFDC